MWNYLKHKWMAGTIAGRGYFDGLNDYPREGDEVRMPETTNPPEFPENGPKNKLAKIGTSDINETKDIAADNVASLPARGHGAVAPQEASIFKEGETQRVKVVRRWHQLRSGLRGRLNLLHHEFQSELEIYTRAHRQHRDDFGLAGFHPKISPSWYWRLLGLLALSELPLNYSAAQALRLADSHTWFIAAGAALASVGGASLGGHGLRRLGSKGAITLITLVLLGATAFMWSFTELRSAFVAHSNPGEELISPLVFFAMLAGFVLVGLALSFSMHPADERLERVLKDKHDSRNRLRSLWTQHVELAAQHDAGLSAALDDLAAIEEDGILKCMQYRDWNRRARKSAPPAYFSHAPTRKLFQALDLGEALDINPASIEQLINTAEEMSHDR